MSGLFAAIPLLFAENAPAAGGSSPGLLNTLAPLLPIPILFYLLIFRPKQLEERKRQEMIAALKPKDKVLTTAGMYGTVVSVDKEQDKVVLRLDDDKGVKFTFSKASIVRVLDVARDKEIEAS